MSGTAVDQKRTPQGPAPFQNREFIQPLSLLWVVHTLRTMQALRQMWQAMKTNAPHVHATSIRDSRTARSDDWRRHGCMNSAGVLSVVGTDANDSFHFRQVRCAISCDGVNGSWSASKVKSIVIDLKDGDDLVSIDSLANGGDKALKEKVAVIAGAGDERVCLTGNQEVHFGGVGQRLDLVPGAAPVLNGTALNLTGSVVKSLKKGPLTVTGTNGNDNISLKQSGGKISIVGSSESWNVSKVKSIVVHMQDGQDTVSLDSLANGGNQLLTLPFTITSGYGNKSVHLADGHNVIFSGGRHTVQVEVNGTAKLDGQVISWDNPDPTPNPDPDPTPNPDPDPTPNPDPDPTPNPDPDPTPNPDPDPTPNPDPDPTPPNWFDAHVLDAALRSFGSNLYVDGLIDRNDAVALFRQVEVDGTVNTTELADLQLIVNTASASAARRGGVRDP